MAAGGRRRVISAREQGDVGKVDAGIGHALHHPVDRVRRGWRLDDAQLPGRLVQDADVGERAADVDGDAQALARGHSLAFPLRGTGRYSRNHRAREGN
jgi:hypothetical protein